MKNLKKLFNQALVGISIGFFGLTASAQVTFDMNGSILIGARNVEVSGSFYDVSFGDNRRYSDVYSTIWPTTYAEARIFATALMEQVVTSHPWDSNPSLINGCNSTVYCGALTFYNNYDSTPGRVTGFAVGAYNYAGSGDHVSTHIITDYATTQNHQISAVWTRHVSAVPEVESYAMMLAGLGMIGVIVRRQKPKKA